MKDKLYHYKAEWVRVIDGDSVVLHIDKGFGDWALATRTPTAEKEAPYPQGRYRLYGINTPEKGRPGWHEAKDRAEALLAMSNEGRVVYVKTYKVGGRGRMLVDVFIPTDNEMIHLNQQLLDEEHAVEYYGRNA